MAMYYFSIYKHIHEEVKPGDLCHITHLCESWTRSQRFMLGVPPQPDVFLMLSVLQELTVRRLNQQSLSVVGFYNQNVFPQSVQPLSS